MRYISQEIGTPLNTVLLGLLYLAKKLPEMTNNEGDKAAVVSECLCIVEDLDISSNNALEVLNEFPTFDKLETSSLILDCTEFPVRVFVEDAVKPFYLQMPILLPLLYYAWSLTHSTGSRGGDRNVSGVLRRLRVFAT